jgi:hypothetical protein
MIAFYIVGLSMKTLRNILFVDLNDSIVEKTTMMTRTATEIKEKTDLKRCFGICMKYAQCVKIWLFLKCVHFLKSCV